MDNDTIKRLNRINQEFYRVTAHHFNATRNESWAGWQSLLPSLHAYPSQHPFSVLDVGCGNARFGVFLCRHLPHKLTYHGLDNSTILLEYARTALEKTNCAFRLEESDLIENPLPFSSAYTLVAAFGVLHHIPGYQQRQDFMRRLAGQVADGGWLVFTSWRFYEQERFRARIVAWEKDIAVEKNDFLLDWRKGEDSLRYCHYIDDEEHIGLIRAAGLVEIATFRADGKSGDLNCYSLLQKPLKLNQ